MRFVEQYNNDKTYEMPDGTPITETEILTMFPSLSNGALIKIEGRTPIEAVSYEYTLSKYNIPKPDDISKGIELINQKLYFEQTESTPIERIASMLEYIAMKMSEVQR